MSDDDMRNVYTFFKSNVYTFMWPFLFRYIIWTEQNFPMGTSIELKQILERCIQHFHTNEKYSDDERFVKIFLKYVCCSCLNLKIQTLKNSRFVWIKKFSYCLVFAFNTFSFSLFSYQKFLTYLRCH